MRLAEKIQTGYARIGEQTTEENRINAYMDFVHLVQTRKPTPEEMAEASLQGSRPLNAIDAGFAEETHSAPDQEITPTTQIKSGSDRMFARAGTLVVANMSHILAVRGYRRNEGESDDYLALINVARASLCHPISAQVDDIDMEYAAVVDMHVQELQPPTQQIAFAAAPGRNSEIYTAGAAGIKPAEFALLHLDDSLDDLVAVDPTRRLSGFFGRMAAISTLCNLTGRRLPQEFLSAQRLSENLRSLVRADINVH